MLYESALSGRCDGSLQRETQLQVEAWEESSDLGCLTLQPEYGAGFVPKWSMNFKVPVPSAGSEQHSESEHGMVYLPHSFATSHDFPHFALHLFNAKSYKPTQTISLREESTPEYYAEGTSIISSNRCECMY